MFEKSKSVITFKEFQDKMNIANDFDDDWGHFYDLDISNNKPVVTPNTIILFKDPLEKPKREFKKLFQKEEEKHQEKEEKELELEKQKEIEKIIKEIFIDVENDNKNDKNDNKNKYYLKDAIKVTIINNIFKCFEVIIVTSVMVYLIFNVL